jgi:hypothetical protein
MRVDNSDPQQLSAMCEFSLSAACVFHLPLHVLTLQPGKTVLHVPGHQLLVDPFEGTPCS